MEREKRRAEFESISVLAGVKEVNMYTKIMSRSVNG